MAINIGNNSILNSFIPIFAVILKNKTLIQFFKVLYSTISSNEVFKLKIRQNYVDSVSTKSISLLLLIRVD